MKDIPQRRNQYRRMFSLDPYRFDAYEKAKRPYKGPNKRQKWCYECASCKGLFLRTQVQCDHIDAAGQYTEKKHEKEFRKKLLEGKLQILCKSCHLKKTNEERRTGAWKRD